MKPKVKSLIGILLILTVQCHLYAQRWDLGGNPDNFPGPNGLLTNSNFLGATQTASVRLGTGNISRIFISGTGSANPGFIGVGSNFLTPVSLLNLNGFGNNTGQLFRTDGNQAAFNRWQMFTGPNAGAVTEKGAFFTAPNSNTQTGGVGLPAVTNLAVNQFNINANLGDVIIGARGVNGFQFVPFSERMRISGYSAPIPNYITPTVPRTRVSISNTSTPITVPLAMLHLGEEWISFNLGPHRNWMDVGTYYHIGSDAMYVGLKHLSNDRNESIISFGNNPSSQAIGDRMRFLFIGAPANGTSTTNQGLEFMHFFTDDGTNPRISIGDFQTQGGNADPNNTIEILPSPTSPYWNWGAGNGTSTSGVRLRGLTSASIIVPNNTNGVDGTKVLTVDQNGDFVLTTPIGGGGGGGGITAAQNGTSIVGGNTVELGLNPLIHNTQIPCQNWNFEINYNSSSNISIGSNPAVYPLTTGGGAAGLNIAIGRQNDFTSQQALALGSNNSVGSQGTGIGFGNTLGNSQVSFAYGLDVEHDNSTGGPVVAAALAFGEGIHNYNSHSTVIGRDVVLPPNGPSMVSIGAHFATAAVTSMENYIAANPTATYPQIDFDAQNSNGGLLPDYIPAINVWDQNMVGVGILRPMFKLDVNGTIRGTAFQTSDSTVKINIQPLTSSASQKVKGFRAISFEWKNKVDTAMYGTQFGFTAQQLETIEPSLVKTDMAGKKILSYNGIVAFLTKAIQEEIKRNDQQDSSVQALMAYINSCCSSNSKTQQNNAASQTTIEVKLSLPAEIYISEARPNPNNGKAEISYYVPTTTTSAKVIFTDMLGRTISEIDLANGYGTMAIDTKDLPNGLYSYTLQADGKIIDTKKMLKQQ